MSYTFLQEQGEESLAECFSDMPAYVLSRLNLTAKRFCSNGNETESCHDSRYGMMSEHSTDDPGEGLLMLSAEDFHALTHPRPGQIITSTGHIEALRGKVADFGMSSAELLRKYNLDLQRSKTFRHCGHADLALSCATLPRWGLMLHGECLEFAALARTISETGFTSLLPTPTRHNAKEGAYPAEFTRKTPTLAAQIGGKINPDWNEWRMGWPIGWTDLERLGTDKFQRWFDSHGKHS